MACPSVEALLGFCRGEANAVDDQRIHDHIDGCQRCRRALSEVTSIVSGSSTLLSGLRLGAFGDEPSFAVGEIVDGYEIGHPIGHGGMATVYAAFDLSLQRTVAVKVLRESTRDAQARAITEARYLAKLAHPNVVSVFHHGVHAGRVFIVMECLFGWTLRRWLATPRSTREILDAFLQAGRGLEAAHRVGLMHGDFKPENVFVTAEGRVAVMDFGLGALIPKGEPGQENEQTKIGGTIPYLAPEVLLGMRPTPLADQFSFCAALYEALNGVRPFRGDSMETLAAEHARGITKGTQRRSGTPSRLQKLVLRGLATSPEDRLPSMRELLHSLERVRASLRARPRNLFIAVAAAALAVAGTSYSFFSQRQMCQPLDGLAIGSENAESLRATGEQILARYPEHEAFVANELPLLSDYSAEWQSVRSDTCGATGIFRPRAASERRAVCLYQEATALERFIQNVRGLDKNAIARGGFIASVLPRSECDNPKILANVPAVSFSGSEAGKVRTIYRELGEARYQILAERVDAGLQMARPLLSLAHSTGSRGLEEEVLKTLSLGAVRKGDRTLGAAYAYAPNESPGGVSHSEWLARWWTWAYETPYARHPLRPDATSCEGSQRGDFFFLGSVITHDRSRTSPLTTRTCVVEEGTSFVMPSLISEASTVPGDNCEDTTFEGLRECSQISQQESVLEEIEVDGLAIPNLASYKTSTSMYSFHLPDDNVMGETGAPRTPAGTYQGVAEGTLVVLRPLPLGWHTLHAYGRRGMSHDANDYEYRVHVIPKTVSLR